MTGEVEQRSEEWFKERRGKVTASRIADVVAKTKTGWGASRANYQAALILERLTGTPQDNFQTQAMLEGIQREPEARAAYEWHSGCEVVPAGFVPHPTIGMSGASPDGYAGANGLIEIKSPQPAAHLATLLGDPIARKYLLQMQWQMRCCDRAWCDFVSYSPAFPEPMRLWVKRIPRDDKLIAGLERDVVEFLLELDAELNKLHSHYPDIASAEAA